jgi:hypothetical protein
MATTRASWQWDMRGIGASGLGLTSNNRIIPAHHLLCGAATEKLKDSQFTFRDGHPVGGLFLAFLGVISLGLTYIIFLWNEQTTVILVVVYAPVATASFWLTWRGLRRKTIVIDPASQGVTRELSVLGRKLRTSDLRGAVERVVVVGHETNWHEETRTHRLTGQAPATQHLGFDVALEGPGGLIKLDKADNHQTAEDLAKAVAKAAGLPAFRRGYYLGAPRPGAINKIQTEEAWNLAIQAGIVITGDPTEIEELPS